MERDKTGRIITGNNRKDERGGDRDRSRERVLRDRLSVREWDNRDEGQQGGQTPGKYGNTYGLSQQFLESLGIDGGLIPKVFVSNVIFACYTHILLAQLHFVIFGGISKIFSFFLKAGFPR